MTRHPPPWVERYLTASYEPGGRGPRGFDCGGLVLSVLRDQFGVDVTDVDEPHSVHEAAPAARAAVIAGRLEGCDRVDYTEAQPGDILLIAPGRFPTHVGIVVARDRFLHALEGAGVAVERMDDRPWRSRIHSVHRPRAGARVVIADVGSPGAFAGPFRALYNAVSSVRTLFDAARAAAPTISALDRLRSSLFPPVDRPDGGTPSAGRPTDPRGFSNELRLYEPVPVHFGGFRFFPDLGAVPYFSVSGNALYQHHLFVIARNKVNVSGIRNGDTPILSDSAIAYSGQIEGDLDFVGDFEIRQDFDPTSTSDSERLRYYPGSVEETPVNVVLKRGASGGSQHWVVRRTPPNTTRVEIQLEFPLGLAARTKNNTLRIVSVRVRAEYRAVGETGAWTKLADRTFRAANERVQRLAFEQDLDEGQYDIRVRRITGFIGGYARVYDSVEWTLFRSFSDGLPIRLAGCTIMTVRARHSNQLPSRLAKLSVEGMAVMSDYTGSTWTERETRNPASMVRYVLQGEAGRRTIPDARIDITQLEAFHDRCRLAGFELDARLVNRTNTHELLERICNVGRASYSVIDGRHTVVMDDPADTTPVQIFTGRNLSDLRGELVYVDELHAVKVKFRNREAEWLEDERPVYNDGYDETNATKFETLTAWGISDPEQVYKYGRWFLALAVLRHERFTITTWFDNLRCVRGSPVRVAHPHAQIGGAAGRLLTVTTDGGGNATALEVDNACTMEAGKTYEIRVQLADGDQVRRAVTTVAGKNTTLTLSTSIPPASVPAVGDHYVFGEYDSGSGLENSLLCRVASIRPGPDLTATLVLEPLAAEAHDADTGDIPTFRSQVQVPPPNKGGPPPPIARFLKRTGSTVTTKPRRKARRGSIRVRAKVTGVTT